MTLDVLLAAMCEKLPPAPLDALERFEEAIDAKLPNDYREFLVRCNGGYLAGDVQFRASTPHRFEFEVHLNHLGGFRKENHFSLEFARNNYQKHETRIPNELIWIADDPYGNAFCLGISGIHRERVYFWQHENEPNPEKWDKRVETAQNILLLAKSFDEFLAGLTLVEKLPGEKKKVSDTMNTGLA